MSGFKAKSQGTVNGLGSAQRKRPSMGLSHLMLELEGSWPG